ncbi:putative fatty acyl-CoA reductase CG5065 [Coccinella septempunctata]|uniref:putative fatty acyl-CoA reductase CG5065 n=1 Tax=Coccinella septempunctata TaxID=41139 RepID=UPI001D071F7F|nr:putative fatty acyl-CoA reductase CG5065 [Coccinella septempunctata]XP_044762652.1 putative fatty acyl-CoA reductase CG5065 [Coccinella septempunctata]XP_044762653.1 putative fatty acyl-CoA reductase CG5065 [Coccinella septempunctata]
MLDSDVAKWFSGKNILITGSTGYMGKVMVEKLLRCCPGISKIYLLIRTKKGKTPTQRIDDFLKGPVFHKIRNQPEVFSKLECISGDLTMENLSLSSRDEKNLRENVEVVFHMAANVRFDQTLKNALILNTLGTKRVLDLACTFENLKAFVHVSTTYCHCDLTVLEEKTYPAPHDPRKLIDIAGWIDEKLLELMTPHLIKNSPNTYAYTKCLAEHLVSEYSELLPIAIARPAAVTAAWKEPLPGWVDNLNGPTGILVGAGKGVIRSMHCNAEYKADIIPVDCTTNSIILVGYHLGSNPRTDIQVFNITNDKDKRISWGGALNLGKKHFYDNPFSVCLWYPDGSIKSSYFVHMLAAFFFHLIPAYFIDFVMVLTGNKPFMVKVHKRIKKGLEVLQYYTTRPWLFRNEKMRALNVSLNETDREMFYVVGPDDYDQYILDYILGARRFCLHEEPDTIPHAKKVLKRLYYLDVCKNILLGCLGFWLFGGYIIQFLFKFRSFSDLIYVLK